MNILELLMKFKADPNIKESSQGETVLHLILSSQKIVKEYV